MSFLRPPYSLSPGEAVECALDLSARDGKAAPAAALEARMTAWFDGLRGPVLAYLLSFRVRHCEAEEIIQETFVALYEHLARGGDDRNIKGWVFRVAHNIAINRFKAVKREEAVMPETWEVLSRTTSDPAATADQMLLQAERRTRLELAIGRLSHQQLQCLNLRVEGFRYREIAGILGISISTVAELLRRAISRLNQEANV